MISCNKSSGWILQGFVFVFLSLAMVGTGIAQEMIPATPPIADPRDKRFQGVTEDWTTPSLTTSSLRAVPALIGSIDEQPNYTVELIQVQWRWGDPIDLYVMKPKGVEKPPVILYLYGYPSDTKVFKDAKFQEFATRGGFAAVGFVSALTGHRYHDVPLKKWFLSELQQSLAVSAHDVQMILNYLSTRGDLDMNRVGMVGQLSGGSIAILASGVDPRIKVLDVFDPWGDWPTWMEKSPFPPKSERADYMKPEFLSTVAGLDPITWLPKVQARKFRLQQRSFELETPAESKQKIQAAVLPGATIEFYKTRAEFADAIGVGGAKSLKWMKDELNALPPPAPIEAGEAKKER